MRWQRIKFAVARLCWRLAALFLLTGCGGPIGFVSADFDVELEQAVQWWAENGEDVHTGCAGHDRACVPVLLTDAREMPRTHPDAPDFGHTERDWSMAGSDFEATVRIGTHVPPEAQMPAIAHEIGHVLYGPGHAFARRSIMWARVEPGRKCVRDDCKDIEFLPPIWRDE